MLLDALLEVLDDTDVLVLDVLDDDKLLKLLVVVLDDELSDEEELDDLLDVVLDEDELSELLVLEELLDSSSTATIFGCGAGKSLFGLGGVAVLK